MRLVGWKTYVSRLLDLPATAAPKRLNSFDILPCPPSSHTLLTLKYH
jgi:hypothetical protein